MSSMIFINFLLILQFQKFQMDSTDEVLITSIIILSCSLLLINQQFHRAKRRYKTRPINRRRNIYGFYKAYFLPMKNNDPEQFFKYTRMNVAVFNKLLTMVTPQLKQLRKMQDSICPEERLALTLQ